MRIYVYMLLLGSLIFTAPDLVWAVNFWLDRVDDSLKWSNVEADGVVDGITNIIVYLVGFFYLIAVIFGIYAWFLIMTSAGDDERIKKWKNIFIYVLVGLIVVFLASTIIRFVVEAFQWPSLWTSSSATEFGVVDARQGSSFSPSVEYVYPWDPGDWFWRDVK